MIFLSKFSLRYASELRQLAIETEAMSRVPSTLGSIRSWQYDSAVSEMACSSSVNKLLVFNGSCQSNFTGACKYRLPRAADRSGVRNCRVACLYVGRSMLKS
ncbi:glutaryl-CoA dehydrogenase mitochondrial precursor [Alternaria alternata]|nr:glutaryl-CoA dehydrogenase mitochondrial precursor [Alternaria alternata]